MTTTEERTWESLRLDERRALTNAAERLAAEFEPTFGRETIERFLASSYDQLAATAKVVHFLPLLAERFARQRLQAVARLDDHHNDGKAVVLFLCTHNAGRSQMALGFFEALAGDTAIAWSGGSTPADSINPIAIGAMQERGSTFRGSSPSPGLTRRSGPLTSSSPWGVATPAQSSPESATRTGTSMIPMR